LFTLRTQRYDEQAVDIRAAYGDAGIKVVQLDSDRPLDMLAADLTALMEAEYR
jgi:hypothetical protein